MPGQRIHTYPPSDPRAAEGALSVAGSMTHALPRVRQRRTRPRETIGGTGKYSAHLPIARLRGGRWEGTSGVGAAQMQGG